MYAKQVSIRLSIAHHSPYVNLNPSISGKPKQLHQKNSTYSVRVFSLFKMFAAGNLIKVKELGEYRCLNTGSKVPLNRAKGT
jgi:hypothetical protein